MPDENRRLGLFLDVKYHGIVAVGMILSIVAVVKLEDGPRNSSATNLSLLKAGMAITATAFGLLAVWTIVTFLQVNHVTRYSKSELTRAGTTVRTVPSTPHSKTTY